MESVKVSESGIQMSHRDLGILLLKLANTQETNVQQAVLLSRVNNDFHVLDSSLRGLLSYISPFEDDMRMIIHKDSCEYVRVAGSDSICTCGYFKAIDKAIRAVTDFNKARNEKEDVFGDIKTVS